MKRGTKAACSAALVAVMLAGGCLLKHAASKAPQRTFRKQSPGLPAGKRLPVPTQFPRGRAEEPALKGINDLTGDAHG